MYVCFDARKKQLLILFTYLAVLCQGSIISSFLDCPLAERPAGLLCDLELLLVLDLVLERAELLDDDELLRLRDRFNDLDLDRLLSDRDL